jgi:hypothetical protein
MPSWQAAPGRAGHAPPLIPWMTSARPAGLVAERERVAQELADLRVKKGGASARSSIEESEVMALRYAGQSIGLGGERNHKSGC